MSKQAAIYARVSTDDQRGNYSIPTQIAGCLGYIHQKGYKLVGDHFVSAQTGQDCPADAHAVRAFVDDFTSRELSRPGLNALLTYLEAEGFDIVVVHAIDRLARDPYIRQTLEREVEKRGAKVEYVLGSYDDTPEGEVRKDLDATFAKWENAKRVERVNRGKLAKAEQGLFVAGRAPFGYRIDKTAFGGLVVHTEEAEVVRCIYRWFVRGHYSLRSIRKMLIDAGVASHRGKRWGKSSILRILNNETYAGVGYYRKYKRTSRTMLELRDPKEWIKYPVTPIIDRKLWKAAQQKLKENRVNRRCTAKYFYLLGGMVFCEHCQRIYTAQMKLPGKSRRRQPVTCYRHRISEGHCRNRYLSAKKVERKVWDEVVKVLINPAHLREGYEKWTESQVAESARQQQHLATLQESITKLEAKRENLTKAYIDPDIQMLKAEYLVQRDAIDSELAEIRKQMAMIQEEGGSVTAPEDWDSLEAFTAEMRELVLQGERPTDEEIRRLFQMLHIKVWVNLGGESRVVGWYTPKKGWVSSTSSTNYVRRPRQLRARA